MKWTLIGVPSKEITVTSSGVGLPAGRPTCTGYPKIGCRRSLTIGISLTSATIGVTKSGPMIGSFCSPNAVRSDVFGMATTLVG